MTMLVTLNDAKTYLNIALTNTTYDAFLTEQIEILSDAIEFYCGRKFLQATYTQTFYADEEEGNKKELYLYHYPLISITEIKDEDDVVTPTSDYRIQKQSSKIVNTTGWCKGNQQLIVVFTAGYTELPTLIKSVLFNLLSERYSKKISGIDLNFGADIQRLSLPGTLSIDFDYTLQNNEAKSALGVILGSQINVLNTYRSERKVSGIVKERYVD